MKIPFTNTHHLYVEFNSKPLTTPDASSVKDLETFQKQSPAVQQKWRAKASVRERDRFRLTLPFRNMTVSLTKNTANPYKPENAPPGTVPASFYWTQFTINDAENLSEKLNQFADDYKNTGKPLVVVSGAGVAGFDAAFRFAATGNFNVIMAEKRPEATRENVLDLKEWTLQNWPRGLVEYLEKNKLITRIVRKVERGENGLICTPVPHESSIIADLDKPRPERNRSLLAPEPITAPQANRESHQWTYPDPTKVGDAAFNDSFVFGQVRDLQKGMNDYLIMQGIQGIPFVRAEIMDLKQAKDKQTLSPVFRIRERARSEHHVEIPVPDELPTFNILSEGKTKRLDSGDFGSADRIQLSRETWFQRNYRLHAPARDDHKYGSTCVDPNKEEGTLIVTQVWHGPKGPAANVSVLSANASTDGELDKLFLDAQEHLDIMESGIVISRENEVFRSDPIPIELTRTNNPVHGNTIFLGDSAGVGSPVKGRGANDGCAQIDIAMELFNDPNYLQPESQAAARAKFDKIYAVRHGVPSRLMRDLGIYTEAEYKAINSSITADRSDGAKLATEYSATFQGE